MILLQMFCSGNRTRVTQPEFTLFRAPYPLDQHSFPFFFPTFHYYRAAFIFHVFSNPSCMRVDFCRNDVTKAFKIEFQIFFEVLPCSFLRVAHDVIASRENS